MKNNRTIIFIPLLHPTVAITVPCRVLLVVVVYSVMTGSTKSPQTVALSYVTIDKTKLAPTILSLLTVPIL